MGGTRGPTSTEGGGRRIEKKKYVKKKKNDTGSEGVARR